jgi:glycosyltransferase involved in cell wall biosynthesis
MQRVLFVTPHLAFGGAERVLASLATALGAAGYAVDILSVTRRGHRDCFDEWFSATGATLTRAAPDKAADLLDQWPLAPLRALVFLGQSPAIRLAPRLHARRPGLRMVGFAFNPVDAVADLTRIRAHLAVTVAESLQAAAALGPDARVALVPSGIDPDLVPQHPVRPESLWVDVGFIGRMDAIKNVQIMPRIAKLLPPDRFRFHLFGDGPQRRRARLRAWLTCPQHDFRWHGRVSDEALAQGFAGLDVLVVPSLIDGRPLVISEAQLRGVAVVASHTGAIPDLVSHGKTGLLCKPGDAPAFAAALLKLADDRAMMARLAVQARHVALAREAPAQRMARYLDAILGV